MENYNRIFLIHNGEATRITYGEYVMYVASPEKDWNYIKFLKHDGDRYWYTHGKLHRMDGPVVEYADGSKEWYVYDARYTEQGHSMAVEYYKNLKI